MSDDTTNDNTQSFSLADSAIANFAQVLQLALILQKDIVEQMRWMKFVPNKENKLVLDPAYEKEFNENIKDLVSKAEEMQKQVQISQQKQMKEPGFVQ